MSVNTIRERHSYLDPTKQITQQEGVVSVYTSPNNPVFSHASLLIEGIRNGRSFHKIYTLEGFFLNNSLSVSATKIAKVSTFAALTYHGMTSYGLTKFTKNTLGSFGQFKKDVDPINAFSLWKISEDKLIELEEKLDEWVANSPPYSLSGSGSVDGEKAYHCFTLAQEALGSVGINAKYSSWWPNRAWVPLLGTSGDAHVGKIESAAVNCLGSPAHLNEEFERRIRAGS